MPDPGHWLEKLVMEIERNLLPQGFTASNRKRVYNENRHQIAEFDIEITGKLGSSQIKWLIECRDRRSSGPEPASWIEQLVARRDRFKFNQVTAVSTTGFAEGAIQYANDECIELRTVSELSSEKIAEWFLLQHTDYLNHFGDLKHTNYSLEDSTTEQQLKCAIELVLSSSTSEPIFSYPGREQKLCLTDIWQHVLDQNASVFDGLQPDVDKRFIEIAVPSPNPEERLYFVCEGKPIKIQKIIFFAELSIIHKRVPITQITEYAAMHSQQSIAQTVRFAVPMQKKNLDLIFYRYSESGNTKVSIRMSDKAISQA